MISQVISTHIIKYLLGEKEYSREELSKLMDITIEEIDKIVHKQAYLKPKNLKNFINKTKYRHWELMYEAVPPQFLTEETIKKIQLCKKLADRVKRNKK